MAARAAVIALLFLSMGFSEDTPEPAVVIEGNQRFVLKQIGRLRADTFMIDTKTGRLWQLVDAGKEPGKSLVLAPIPYKLTGGVSFMTEDVVADIMCDFLKKKTAYPALDEYLQQLWRSLIGEEPPAPSAEKPKPAKP